MDYEMRSFHGYVIEKLKDKQIGENWPLMETDKKVSLYGLLWTAYLDRLQYANFDIRPIVRSMENMMQTANGQIGKIKPAHPETADLLCWLNQQNARYLQLMQDDDEETYEELSELGKGLFHRFVLMRKALLETNTDPSDVDHSLGLVVEAMHQTADHIRNLALRHFYSAFQAGHYKVLASLCAGSGFILGAAGCLLACTELPADANKVCTFVNAFEREYDMAMLCSMGREFDFYLFDDETNVLLPEVAELLYPL